MKFPKDHLVKIRSYRQKDTTNAGTGDFDIRSISVLGYDDVPVTFERTAEALNIQLNGDIQTDYPICLKIVID